MCTDQRQRAVVIYLEVVDSYPADGDVPIMTPERILNYWIRGGLATLQKGHKTGFKLTGQQNSTKCNCTYLAPLMSERGT
jgi:hypothetical protein